MRDRQPYQLQIRTRGSDTLKVAAPGLADLSQTELECISGGGGRAMPDRLSVSNSAAMEWDDGWWHLDFK